MTVTHEPLTADGALSGEKAVYSPVLVRAFSEIFSSFAFSSVRSLWDTEGYTGSRFKTFQMSQSPPPLPRE